jgi:hypothetical protein
MHRAKRLCEEKSVGIDTVDDQLLSINREINILVMAGRYQNQAKPVDNVRVYD